MGESFLHEKIVTLRNRIIDTALIVGVFLGVLAYALSWINYSNSTNKLSYLTDFIVLIAISFVAFWRKRFSIKSKSIIIIAGLLVVVIVDLVGLGVHSENLPLIIMVPFFSILAFNLRRTITIFIFSLLLVSVVGFLFVNGFLHLQEVDFNRYLKTEIWIIALIIVSIVSTVILIIMTQFNSAFTKLILDLEKKNIDLAHNEQSYREIFNSSSDAIFVHNELGEILDVNDAMLKMYGYTKEEVLHLKVGQLSSSAEGFTEQDARRHMREAGNKEKITFDWQAKRKNGEVFWVEVALKRAEIIGKRRVLAVIRDIDEKKKTELQLKEYRVRLEDLVKERTKALELTNIELNNSNKDLLSQREELRAALEKLKATHEKLLNSEKMASLGVLAAGVAHEINNPLHFIQTGALGLENYFEDHYEDQPEEVEPLLNAINEGVQRSADIVTSLNQFSRQNNEKKEECDLHNIIDNCLTILANKMKYKVGVEKNFTPEGLILSGVEGKLHQAILNILSNASQAIEKEGRIDISTSIQNGTATLVFSDNGVGISPENLAKLTEPFFTTKPSGEGTGLGLSITQKIIEEHDGELLFDSIPGNGTTVTIKLPLNK